MDTATLRSKFLVIDDKMDQIQSKAQNILSGMSHEEKKHSNSELQKLDSEMGDLIAEQHKLTKDKNWGKVTKQLQSEKKSLDDESSDEGGMFDLLGFNDDNKDDSKPSNKQLPKKKAPPNANKGAYYRENKTRIDNAKKLSDKNRLALRKSKMAEKLQKGRDDRRFHQNVSSCHFYGKAENCKNDKRCDWSDKTKPNCRHKKKNIFTVPDPEQRAAKKALKLSKKSDSTKSESPKRQVSKKVPQIKDTNVTVVNYFSAKNGRCMAKLSNGKVRFARKEECNKP